MELTKKDLTLLITPIIVMVIFAFALANEIQGVSVKVADVTDTVGTNSTVITNQGIAIRKILDR